MSGMTVISSTIFSAVSRDWVPVPPSRRRVRAGPCPSRVSAAAVVWAVAPVASSSVAMANAMASAMADTSAFATSRRNCSLPGPDMDILRAMGADQHYVLR